MEQCIKDKILNPKTCRFVKKCKGGYKKNKKKWIFFKISRKSPIRPPRAVRAARGAFNVWLRTIQGAAT